jgi:hypothetical protein
LKLDSVVAAFDDFKDLEPSELIEKFLPFETYEN